MNTATTQPPKLDLATSYRLKACMVSFGLLGLAAIWRDREDLDGLIVQIVTFPALIFVAWFGVYRSPFLHRLFGVVCLLVSVGVIALLVVWLFGLREFRVDQISLYLVLSSIQMPILAYLLVFDRKISTYRRQLAAKDSQLLAS